MESLLFQSIQRTLAHDKEVFILLKLLYKAVKIGKVFRNLSIDQCNQQRTSHVFHTLQCFFVVIQISQCHNQLIIFILLDILFQFCIVIHIHSDKTDIFVCILQRLTASHDLTKFYPLHGNTVNLFSKLGTDLADFFLVCNRKLISCHIWKNCADIFLIKLILSGKFCKYLI